MSTKGRCPFEIDRDEFYDTVVTLIDGAQESVLLYSVSACFGFWSRGIRVFEQVFKALQAKLEIKKPALDVRCLIQVDDHAFDQFAARQFARLNITQPVARAISSLSSEEQVQFVLVDRTSPKPLLLFSEVQEIRTTPVFGINVNKMCGGLRYSWKCNETKKAEQLFERKWKDGNDISSALLDSAAEKVIASLGKYEVPHAPQGEVCVTHNLASFLKGSLGSAYVATQAPCSSGRMDIVVSSGLRRICIEVKHNLKKNDVDKVIGQLNRYKAEADTVILYSVSPKYSLHEKTAIGNRMRDAGLQFIDKR
jgi:hypothetical protein